MHPIASHPFAQLAAQAALAAQRQGHFLEMNELLLDRYRQFNSLGTDKATEMGLGADKKAAPDVQKAMFADFARELGLDVAKFESDFDDPAIKKRIADETREVVSIGATGTPANFVNGRYLRGAQPYEEFKKLIDAELAK